MTDAIGDLRWRLELQKPVLMADDIGGGARGFASMGFAWAQVRAVSQQRDSLAEAPGARSQYECVLRMRRDVRPGWRVKRGARTFRVITLADQDSKGARLVMIVEEEFL